MRKLLLISLMLIAFFIAVFIKVAYSSSSLQVIGCLKPDNMTEFVILQHVGAFSTLYEISSDKQKFLLMVQNYVDNGELKRPTLQFGECNPKSNIKIFEQSEKDVKR